MAYWQGPLSIVDNFSLSITNPKPSRRPQICVCLQTYQQAWQETEQSGSRLKVDAKGREKQRYLFVLMQMREAGRGRERENASQVRGSEVMSASKDVSCQAHMCALTFDVQMHIQKNTRMHVFFFSPQFFWCIAQTHQKPPNPSEKNTRFSRSQTRILRWNITKQQHQSYLHSNWRCALEHLKLMCLRVLE